MGIELIVLGIVFVGSITFTYCVRYILSKIIY